MDQLTSGVFAVASLVSTLVVTIATVALAIFTARYVRLTRGLVEESRRSRCPLVNIDFEVPDHRMNLVIENHGLSPARDVRIELVEERAGFEWIGGFGGRSGLAEVAGLRKGVSYLTPARRLKYEVGFPNWSKMPEGPVVASFRVGFSSLDGERFEQNVDFDFDQLRGVLFESFRDPSQDVAKAIRDSESSRRSHQQFDGHFRSLIAPATKKCVMCSETILMDAKKCHFCGEMQDVTERPSAQKKQGRRTAESSSPDSGLDDGTGDGQSSPGGEG
jgi:hypothetical protein